MIAFDQMWAVYLSLVFPGIVAFRVSFPFDQVLEPSRPAMTPMVFDLFHFIFFFSSNKVRWGSGEVGAMAGVFVIGG